MAPLGSTATLDTLASCQLAPPHILDVCHYFGVNSQSNKPLNEMDDLASKEHIISTGCPKKTHFQNAVGAQQSGLG